MKILIVLLLLCGSAHAVDYWVYPTENKADQGKEKINEGNWYPVTFKEKGQLAPSKQKMIKWCEWILEMKTGEYAILAMPDSMWTYMGVPEADKQNFLSKYAKDVRALTPNDFVHEGE